MPSTFFTRCATVLVLSASLPAFGVAVLNNPPFMALGAGLTNAIVRIDETESNGSDFVGTGTIIKVTTDGRGGNFYDVLTADHVVRDLGNNNIPQAVYIGFGNLDKTAAFTTNWPIAVNSVAQNVKYDAPVDLALLAVDVPATTPANVVAPANITPANLGTAAAANGPNLIVAGYGNTGSASTQLSKDAYKWNSTSIGSYSIGTTNYYTATTANYSFNGTPTFKYTFQALQNSFKLTPAGSGAAATSGTAFFLDGDSGGPTFELNAAKNALVLVGVHSGVTAPVLDDDNNKYSLTGDQDYDVDISQYMPFITAAQTQVNQIPEPSTAFLMLAITAASCFSRRTPRLF